MTPAGLAITGGCLLGAGVWVLLAALTPHRVDLAAALNPDRRIMRPVTSVLPAPQAQPSPGRPLQRLQAGLEARLEARLAGTGLVTPDADLSVVELTRGQFILIRAAAGFGGLLAGPLWALIFAVAGTGVPVMIPALAGVVLGMMGWLVTPRVVHEKAEARRREMRYALVSYLTLVALHRAAGQGMAAALELSARSSPAWTFRRIGSRIDSALRSGIPPWDGLAGLAAEIGIDELSDLASIADTAGTGGAGVYSTLLAKARALRNSLQSDEEKSASIMSARMVVPKALLGMVTLLFLLYPAVTLIGGT